MSYLIGFLLALVSLYCTDFSLNDILFIYNYYKSCTDQLLSFLIKVVSNGGRKGMLSPLLEVSAWNTWPHLKGLSHRCPILSVHSADIQRAADQFPRAPPGLAICLAWCFLFFWIFPNSSHYPCGIQREPGQEEGWTRLPLESSIRAQLPLQGFLPPMPLAREHPVDT